ncbi:glycosyltransferase family 4 protein [Chlorobium sp.]|uniref:glycosyltransferase family 4 protein n=1 Tax=Chlorobium sp. TaxID=1095 RepID=UPI002F41C163
MNPTNRLKIAIIYGPLLHYRVALFEILSRRYELTVFTTKFNRGTIEHGFTVIEIPALHLGPFHAQIGLRRRLLRGRFDVCISFLDVRHIDSLAAVFFPITPRTFCWGVWLTRSGIANYIRLSAIKRCEAALFYCYEHLQEVAELESDLDKLYVAPNTFAVPDVYMASSPKVRDSILFVGSFAPRKGLERLVRLFASALSEMPGHIRLVLLGDGSLREQLIKLTNDLGVSGRVEMPGRVNDTNVLAYYYSRALVSVSLSQAGLSVLQSMGFGVPFLTIRGSISGGEINNISNGITGFLIDDDDTEIIKNLRTIVKDPVRMLAMGAAAKAHYRRYASIQNYAQGFFDMLEGTRLTNVWKGEANEHEIY